jgi:hypothetical protein
LETHIKKLILALFIASTAAFAGVTDAPFGLSWGASVEESKSSGVELKGAPTADYGDTYVSTKLPRAVADQDQTFLSFGHNDKLWRIIVIGRATPNDPHGGSIKARYQELVEVLTERYGKGRSYHVLGDSIFSQSQYFLAGIRDGKSTWYTNFDTPEVQVQIGILAESGDTGRWRIIYEYKPLRKSFEESRRLREKGTL